MILLYAETWARVEYLTVASVGLPVEHFREHFPASVPGRAIRLREVLLGYRILDYLLLEGYLSNGSSRSSSIKFLQVTLLLGRYRVHH